MQSTLPLPEFSYKTIKMPTFKYINKLQGKRVLIFGGTSGIGHAVAEALLEHGAKIVISGSTTESLQRAVDRLQKAYPDVNPERIATSVCDLVQTDTLEGRLRELLKEVVSKDEQKIDHIVFTAGNRFDVAGGITGTDIPLVNSIMAVRVYAPILIAKVIATTDYVTKSASTSFTFTSGTAHTRPIKTWPVIAMMSGALQGLATGLAVELAPIRVNVVNPGLFKTELASKWVPEALEAASNMTLTKRLGQPEDIAEAYLYFMKDASVDGTALVSDNGKVVA
jgi:NAD(P)-dependent dehydrogenase (short-subunit alcohol dehydrogenase family)